MRREGGGVKGVEYPPFFKGGQGGFQRDESSVPQSNFGTGVHYKSPSFPLFQRGRCHPRACEYLQENSQTPMIAENRRCTPMVQMIGFIRVHPAFICVHRRQAFGRPANIRNYRMLLPTPDPRPPTPETLRPSTPHTAASSAPSRQGCCRRPWSHTPGVPAKSGFDSSHPQRFSESPSGSRRAPIPA